MKSCLVIITSFLQNMTSFLLIMRSGSCNYKIRSSLVNAMLFYSHALTQVFVVKIT